MYFKESVQVVFMRLKRIFMFIIVAFLTVSAGEPVCAEGTVNPAPGEQLFSVTGVVVMISDDSITVLAKEKEREFSIKGAVIKYCGKVLTDDVVRIVYCLTDKRSALEIQMVTLSDAHEVIYLTFDDGPDAANTSSIINTLAKYKAGGTFFFTGTSMLAYKTVVKAAYDNGFAIGLHGYAHTSFAKMSEAGLRYDINRTNEVLYSITGKYSSMTRPPYGDMNSSARNTLSSMGFKNYFWTVDTRDWEKKNSADVLDNIKSADLRSGDIILMHSGPGQSLSAQMLPQIIEYVRSRGLEPVNLPG